MGIRTPLMHAITNHRITESDRITYQLFCLQTSMSLHYTRTCSIFTKPIGPCFSQTRLGRAGLRCTHTLHFFTLTYLHVYLYRVTLADANDEKVYRRLEVSRLVSQQSWRHAAMAMELKSKFSSFRSCLPSISVISVFLVMVIFNVVVALQ